VKDKRPRLPFPGKALLWLFLDGEDYEQAAGDFKEHYLRHRRRHGPMAARLRFWGMLLKSLPHFIADKIYWRMDMIRSNLKMAWRIITRQKLYSLLNIAGLSVSLVCLLMILLHVRGELGYERGFPKSERIYRVQTDSRYGSISRRWALSATAIGPELAKTFPEIEAAARIIPIPTWQAQVLAYQPAGEAPRRFEEEKGFFADAGFLSMFGLIFAEGNPETALRDPSSVVLTSSFARKYFGDEKPIGKTLINETLDKPLLVTGIIRDMPAKTHLKIDYLASISTLAAWTGRPNTLDNRTAKRSYTYILLRTGRGPETISAQAGPFMKTYHAADPGRSESILLQPIRSIHLHSKLEGELGPNSDITYILAFSGAAFLILLIAVVNFVNLATAQAFKRIKEIGVRKVLGAKKIQIVKQYLGEASLLTILSAGLALILIRTALPFYNHLTGAALTFRHVFTPVNAATLAVLLLFLALAAGLYPALFVSSFQPTGALKRHRIPGSSTARLRQGLVIFQFVISIVLIFSAVTMARQLSFFRNQDLGFRKDHVVAVKLHPNSLDTTNREANALKAEARRHAGVEGVALTSNLFGKSFGNTRLIPPGTQDPSALTMMRWLFVDEDFITSMGLTILQGRNFAADGAATPAFIISESAAAALQLKDPIGLECSSDGVGTRAPIIGVIKDFHFASLHSPLEPLVLEYRPVVASYLLVRVRDGQVPQVLEYLKAKAREINPDFLFSYSFVDEVFDQNYRTETQSFDLFKIFSAVALFVACLGLFGLAVFAAESRVKEIGIRKTLGASLTSICALLSGAFVRQVLAANVIALPLAYLAMRGWLQNFAFHTNISIGTFLLAGSVAVLLAIVTVGIQALRAARENPIKSLRHE
jgi:putative ABC transport system permease protein